MTVRRLFHSRAALALAALVLPVLLVAAAAVPAAAQDASEFFLRLNRLENQVRELAGTVEKLDFENRRLQEQLKRFQEDAEFRFQDLEAGKGAPAKQKRSELTPAAPQVDEAGARQEVSLKEITQTTTPAVPASSISAEALAPGVAATAAEAEEARLAAADEAPAAGGNWEAAGEAAAVAAPALALPRIDSPAVTTAGQDEYGGAGRPLDLGAVAGAGRPDTLRSPPSVAVLPATNTAVAGIPSVAATAPGDPQVGFRNAEASLRRQDYEAAEMGFREFLQSHPRDGLAPEATYHLGESYFFRGRYREAAEQYLKLTTTFSASALAPEGMLKLGMSLEALGARDQACATFSETTRKFPNASPEVRQGITRARGRANCA